MRKGKRKEDVEQYHWRYTVPEVLLAVKIDMEKRWTGADIS